MSNSTSRWRHTTVCGTPYCMFVMDVNKCEPAEYYEFDTDSESIFSQNMMNANSAYINLVFVDMQSGGGVRWLPWITIQAFTGTGDPHRLVLDPDIYAQLVYAAICLTGMTVFTPTTCKKLSCRWHAQRVFTTPPLQKNNARVHMWNSTWERMC